MKIYMDKLIIPRMDLVVTTKCSLRCEGCANLMQYYENPLDVDIEVIYKSMGKLLSVADSIGRVFVLGGEPFVYKQLDKVLAFLSNYKNIDEIIVVTNGTICPLKDSEKLWGTLQHPKVTIRISDYGDLSRNIDVLIEYCKKKNVAYIREEKGHFYDVGNMIRRNRTEEELNTVFKDCGTKCRSLFNGKFYFCPREAHGIDLGLVPKIDDEYVDLMAEVTDEVIKERIYNFINRKRYIEACDFCDIRTPGYYDRKLPLAKQAKHVLYV